MEFITGTSMTLIKFTAVFMSIGVVVSGIYGMTKAGPHLVNDAVGTLDTLKVRV